MSDPNPGDPGFREKSQNQLVLSFLWVRFFVGLVGLLVPLLLIAYTVTAGNWQLAPSISDFFHTGGREIMVGGLSAVAVFLFAYKGFEDDPRWPSDRLVSRFTAVAALCVAFFPNKLLPGETCSWLQCIFGGFTKYVHYGAAIAFFAGLAVFCLVNFRRSALGTTPSKRKQERNVIFLMCGIGLVVSLVAIILGSVFDFGGSFVFWAESVGVWIFAVSWLFKGESLGPLARVAQVLPGR